MKKILKPDGKIGIIDNLNDGFLWDQASCRILYLLTTTKNPLVVKLCKRLGSNSAGVGVCMLSRKMWHKLANSAGMDIIDTVDSEPDQLGILKRVCLLNKSYREFNLMIFAVRLDANKKLLLPRICETHEKADWNKKYNCNS